MKIAVYTFCYNEEFLLPYFFRHYQKYTNDITVYDNQSTDRSLEIIKQHQSKVVSFDTQNQIRDDILRDLKNNCWKEKQGSGTDWIFLVDMDEFIFHPDLLAFLTKKQQDGVTVLIPQGYTMLSEKLPVGNGQIYAEVDHGVLDDTYSKPIIFDPSKIEEMNYSAGCHFINPVGKVVVKGDPALKLLHFSHLSLQWLVSRYRGRASRLSQINISNKWGQNYFTPEEILKLNFEIKLKEARKVV